MLTKKKKLPKDETVALTKEYNVIIKQMFPSKLKDLGNFIVPCFIENSHNISALIDFRESINLMSLSIYKKLGFDYLKAQSIIV